MPFCSQCGNQVGPADIFCGRCGTRQPVSPAAPVAGADPLGGVTPRTASILCYIPAVGWIASVIVLASDRFRLNRAVRFHAFQGLYLGVAWVMNSWVLGRMYWWDMHVVHDIVRAALAVMAIFMMIKASHEIAYPLPLFGELAQRSVTED